MSCSNYHKNNNTPTISNISDKLWNTISSTLPTEKSNNTVGCHIVPFRKVMDGILYVLRSGCQWKMPSSEYGSSSRCHRRFQQGWIKMDTF